MPPNPTPKTTGSAKSKKKTSKTEEDEFEEWRKSRQLLKPKDQLELSDAELKEIVPRVLQIINMQHPDSLVLFDHASGTFIPIPSPGNLVLVRAHRGTYLHMESEDARKQLIAQGIDVGQLTTESQMSVGAMEERQKEEEEELREIDEEEEEEEEGGEQQEGGDEKEEEEAKPARGKKLPNQFNFCERAALTYNNPCRDQGIQTIPPVLNTFSAHVLQWIIYDGYQEDFAEQELERERERERKEKDRMPATKHKPPPKKRIGKAQLSEAVQGRVYECWKTLERMLNQNTYNYIAQDYRYWDDPADEYREEEGTLLPLWKLSYDKTKKNTITDLCWNPHYYDLFVASFGQFDFTKPIATGAVCFFTLKNPSFPDYICMTESAAMCLDIHKNYPYMMVVGLYDGNVLVYNIEATCTQSAYTSLFHQKHNSVVCEVKWAPNMPDGEMNFFSVSSDGKVNHWILMQNEFAVTTIINLYLETGPVRGPDGTLVRKIASATAIVFHPTDKRTFMVGTEEGLIYKCSTEYSSAYLLTYKAHHLAVYRIAYNTLNYDIFASCSADWRIKVWEDGRLEPLYVFDLGACVGDVMWAPYSSTVLGAVTLKGKAYIFDLNVSKYKAICEQGIVPRKKFRLTRICFNYNLPIIICGDDKGCIQTLKLSPNLRIQCKPPKKQQWLDQETLQKMKLDKLLSTVREPITLTRPPDPLALKVDTV